MINHEAVQLAVRKQLLTLTTLPTSRSWENRFFTPPNPAAIPVPLWIKESYMPVAEVPTSSDWLVLTALMQYDVFCPIGAGTHEAEVLAKAIGDKFKPGASTLDGPTEVIVDKCERRVGFATPDGVWYQIPIQLTIRHYSAR